MSKVEITTNIWIVKQEQKYEWLEAREARNRLTSKNI